MIMTLARPAQQCRDVDVDPVRGYFVATQLKDIGEGKSNDRSVVSCVGYFALASRRLIRAAPTVDQPVLARPDGPKESCHGDTDFKDTLNHWRIAKAKLRIRRQKVDEPGYIARIDGLEQAFPPIGVLERSLGSVSTDNTCMSFNHCLSIRPS